jgi:hypothetical protein
MPQRIRGKSNFHGLSSDRVLSGHLPGHCAAQRVRLRIGFRLTKRYHYFTYRAGAEESLAAKPADDKPRMDAPDTPATANANPLCCPRNIAIAMTSTCRSRGQRLWRAARRHPSQESSKRGFIGGRDGHFGEIADAVDAASALEVGRIPADRAQLTARCRPWKPYARATRRPASPAASKEPAILRERVCAKTASQPEARGGFSLCSNPPLPPRN